MDSEQAEIANAHDDSNYFSLPYGDEPDCYCDGKSVTLDCSCEHIDDCWGARE